MPDCDGMTSAAILLNYLNCIAPHWVQTRTTYWAHDGKKHGIYLDEIPEDIGLLIVPDAGSENYNECKELKARGIDILIIDHHLSNNIPEDAIIINNQLCNYPTKSLSGAGIVWKFCCYIDSLLDTNYAQNYLDLAATGVTIDVMDLRAQETHALVQKGFAAINNPFLKAYIEAEDYNMKGIVNPTTVGWNIGPGINATTRSGTQAENLFLFEALLEYRCNELVPSTKRGCSGQMETRIEQAIRNCKNIRNRQNNVKDAQCEIIDKIIEKENLLDNKILIVRLPKGRIENRNMFGLLANHYQTKHRRPTLILTETELGWEGSGRNYPGCPIKNLNQWLTNTGFIEYCAGHEEAFGVGIAANNVDALIAAANIALKDFECSFNYEVDFIYDAFNFKARDIAEIASLSDIWGHKIEESLIAIENVRATAETLSFLSPDKHPTIKISLPNGVELMKFKSSQDEYEELYSANGCVYLNIIGTCGINNWNNTPQVYIKDYEIIRKQEYYF